MANKYSQIATSIDARLEELSSGSDRFPRLLGELVYMWGEIQRDKQKAESYHPVRMNLERELLHFTGKVKLAYRFVKDTSSEPEWMRRGREESGRKEMGSFFDGFFRELRSCDQEVLGMVEERLGNPGSYYRKCFVRWRVLRRYEAGVGRTLKSCILRARRLRMVLDGLGELGSV